MRQGTNTPPPTSLPVTTWGEPGLIRFALWTPQVILGAFLALGILASVMLLCVSAPGVLLAAQTGDARVTAGVMRQVLLASVGHLALAFAAAVFVKRHIQRQAPACATTTNAKVDHTSTSIDNLTDLPNRALLQDRLEHTLARAKRSGEQVALLLIDLDRFTTINDTLGRSEGNQVLQQVARRLKHCTRASDTLARFGGDTFALIAADLNHTHAVNRIAQKLLEVFKTPFDLPTGPLTVAASIGISLYPTGTTDSATDSNTLFAQADSAVYRAKAMGRNDSVLYSDTLSCATLEHLGLEQHLRRAVEQEQFTLYYQPISDLMSDLTSDKVVAAEALLRWHHPTLGMVSPERFIPLAEETGLIVPLGAWALRQACHQACAWQRAGLELALTLNVSAVQLAREDFAETVAQALRESGLQPQGLTLELTEQAVMHADAPRRLAALRKLGVQIALDDFGRGYSSLGRLHTLPLSGLKLDQAFVQTLAPDVPEDERSRGRAILHAILGLAAALEVHTVAQGVESEAQRLALREFGCERAQGDLIAQPMPAAALEVLLRHDPRKTPSPVAAWLR